MKRVCLLTLLVGATAFAQDEDGKTLYVTLCSACHGADGEGAQAGQFPPLADSAWVKGPADRMIQVVLHGLMGEIKVPSQFAANDTYNLVMPPQGAAMTDEQIAKVSTYVRSSWGNEESAVTAEMVAAQRKASAGKTGFWQAEDLLDKYPLEGSGSEEESLPVDVPIKDLLSYVYVGSWDKLPDFSKLEPVAVEEEHKGRIAVSQSGKKEKFGMVWEGRITAPKSGKFSFRLASDDGSRLIVAGKRVIDHDGVHAMGAKDGSIELAQGEHPIRIEYFEKSGEEGISLSMRGPGLGGDLMLSEGGPKGGGKKQSMPIYPLTNEAVIYRNFIEGTTARAIGVGYHGGVNLAFSADTMSIDLIWTGQFMDGSRHWSGRGQGNQPPAGKRVIKLNQGAPFALLSSQTSAWPKEFSKELEPRFRGYKFNKRMEPTFFYTLGNLQVSDMPQPVIGGNKFGLKRSLTIDVPAGAPPNLHFRAASNLDVKELGGNRFALGEDAVLEVGGAAGGTPFLKGRDLIVPLQLKKGENVLNLHYTWK